MTHEPSGRRRFRSHQAVLLRGTTWRSAPRSFRARSTTPSPLLCPTPALSTARASPSTSVSTTARSSSLASPPALSGPASTRALSACVALPAPSAGGRPKRNPLLAACAMIYYFAGANNAPAVSALCRSDTLPSAASGKCVSRVGACGWRPSWSI